MSLGVALAALFAKEDPGVHVHRALHAVTSEDDNFSKDILAGREIIIGDKLLGVFFMEPSDRQVRSKMFSFARLRGHAFREGVRAYFVQGQ